MRLLYKAVIFFLVLAGCAFLFSSCATSHKTREVVRPISLDMPTDYRMSSYLGFLKPRKSFLLTEIKTDILIANVFQSRCPHCQGLTRNLNKIYDLVEKEGLSHKVKFISLGYGDDFVEVEDFKKRYNIRYPVFADPLAEKVKVKHIPATFILKMTPAGAKVLYEYYGVLPNAKDLIDTLRSELGPAS
jgi:thiol-disulfide isomerase/thioredoxin